MDKLGFHCNVKGGELKKLKKKWVVFDKQSISIEIYPKSSSSTTELVLPFFECQIRMVTVEELKANGIKEKEKDFTLGIVYKSDNYIFNFENKEAVENWFNAVYAINNVSTLPISSNTETTTTTTTTTTATHNEKGAKKKEKDKSSNKGETPKNKDEEKKEKEKHSSKVETPRNKEEINTVNVETPRKNSISSESPRKSSTTDSPRKNSTESSSKKTPVDSPRKTSTSTGNSNNIDSPRKNSSSSNVTLETPRKNSGSSSSSSSGSSSSGSSSNNNESPRKNSKTVQVIVESPISTSTSSNTVTVISDSNDVVSDSKKKSRRASTTYNTSIAEEIKKEEVISPRKHKGSKSTDSSNVVEHKKEKASKKDKKKEDNSHTHVHKDSTKKEKKEKKIKVVKFAQDNKTSDNSSNDTLSISSSSSSIESSNSESTFSPSSSVGSEDKVVYHVIKDADKKSKRKSINLVFTKTSKSDLFEDSKQSQPRSPPQQQSPNSSSLYVPIQQDLADLSPESRRRRSASVPHPVDINVTNTESKFNGTSAQVDTLKKKRIEFVLNKLNEPTKIKKPNRPALMQTVSAAVMGKHSRPSLLRRGSLDDIFEDNKKNLASSREDQVESSVLVEEILSMKWDDFAKSLPRRIKNHTYYKDLAKNNKRILEDGQTIINAFKLFQKPEELAVDNTPLPPPPPPLPINTTNTTTTTNNNNNNNNIEEPKVIPPSEVSFKDLLAKKFAEKPTIEEVVESSDKVSNEDSISSAPPLPPPLPPKIAELRVNMLSYGNNEIEYEEMFGITKDGLNIYMINVELPSKVEAVLPRNYGIFYENDCYLVLNIPKETETMKKSSDKTLNLHIWVGSKSSVDKRAIAAIRAVELNKYMNDKGIHFREEQGIETDQFSEPPSSIAIP